MERARVKKFGLRVRKKVCWIVAVVEIESSRQKCKANVLPDALSRIVNFFSAGSKFFGWNGWFALSAFHSFTAKRLVPTLPAARKPNLGGACLIRTELGTSDYARTTLPQLHSGGPPLAGSGLVAGWLLPSTPMSRRASRAHSPETPQLSQRRSPFVQFTPTPVTLLLTLSSLP